MTPIPSAVMKVIEAETAQEYEKRATGFSTTIGSVMAQNLDCPHYEWHKKYTSIDRFEMILNASKSLAAIYKAELESKASVETAGKTEEK
jgi:hypothetical protein